MMVTDAFMEFIKNRALVVFEELVETENGRRQGS